MWCVLRGSHILQVRREMGEGDGKNHPKGLAGEEKLATLLRFAENLPSWTQNANSPAILPATMG
jgi:hypothetical protein